MLRHVFLIAAFVFISSCGGGGGSSSEPGSGGVAPTRPFGSIQGVAYDGAIAGGIVTAYAFTKLEGKGEVLGSITTNDDGSFDLPIQTRSQLLLIEVSGGRYTEEATGTSVSLSTITRQSIVLRTFIKYESGDTVESSITPYTNLAAGLAEYLMQQGASFEEAVNQAYQQIDTLTGFDVRLTRPMDVTDENNALTELNDNARYGLLLAGISQLTAELGEAVGQNAHVLYTSYDFADAMYRDIALDGVLNGAGFSESGGVVTDVRFAGEILETSQYREALGASVLTFVQSDNNALQLDTGDVLPFVQLLSASDDSVFNEIPAQPIDSDGPTIQNIADSNFRGDIELAFTINDFVGVDQVTLFIDGNAIGNANDPDNPVFDITTTDYDDGDHTIRIVAVDNLGNESIRDFPVFFDPAAGNIIGSALNFADATITVYTLNDDGSKQSPLITTTTDNKGGFSFELDVLSQPLLVELTEGDYTELASNKNVALSNDDVLRTFVNYEKGASLTVMVSPYTNMAAGLVQDALNKGQALPVAIEAAQEIINDLIGFNAFSTSPIDVSDSVNEFIGLNNNVRYGYLFAGLSQYTATVSERVEDSVHSNYTSIAFASLMYEDALDGVLDGIGQDGELMFADVPISANVYRSTTAESIVVFANTENNALAITSADLVSFAQSIASNTNAIFNGVEPIALDSDGPSIAHGFDETIEVDGVANFSFTVADFIGVQNVTIWLDGEAVENTGSLTSPAIVIDTEQYVDGFHEIRIEASDYLNNASTLALEAFFLPDIGSIAGTTPITGGDITLYALTPEGEKGEVIETTSTNNTGRYSLTGQVLTQPVLLEVTNGNFREYAGGSESLSDGQRLTALLDYTSGIDHTLNINVWTHAGFGLTQFKIDENIALTQAITEAKEEIMTLAGVDVFSLEGIDPTETNAETLLTDAIRFGLLESAISSYTLTFGDHELFNSMSFADALYQDIRDGRIDGLRGEESVLLGGADTNANTYRSVVAGSLIGFIKSDDYALLLDVDDILPLALQLQNNTHALFGDAAIANFDSDGPSITVTIEDDLFGDSSIGVAAEDFTGIASLRYFIDDIEVGSATTSIVDYDFSTFDFASGDHTLRVEATDLLDNVTSQESALYFLPQFGNISGVSAMRNADITVFALDGQGNRSFIDSTTTNSDGVYTLDIQSLSQPVLLELVDGSYVEPASGRSVSMGDDEVLTATINYGEASSNTVNINVWSHAASGLAFFNSEQGVDLASAIDAANNELVDLIGYDILRVNPLDVTDEDNQFEPLTSATNAGLITASISELTAGISIDAGDNPHDRYTSIGFAQVLYNDIVSDGFLNGAGFENEGALNQLSYGNTIINANSYRSELGGSLVAFVQNERFALEQTVSDILPLAIDLQESNDAVFADIPTASFDNEPPSIGIPGGSNNYDATVEIPFTIDDFTGIASVVFFVDGDEVATASSPSAPSLTLDTEVYRSGEHQIRVEATDLLGNSDSITYDVFFLPPVGELAGVAHDGPIVNGTVNAYEYDGQAQDLIASAVTDDIGDYVLDVQSLETPILLEVTNGRYVEEASNRTITLSAGQKLSGLTFYEEGAQIDLQLTHYTYWASCLADYLIANEGLTVGNAITQANETFVNISGVPITTVKPVDITRPENFTNFSTPGHLYGYLLAAISGLTADIAEENGMDPHSTEQYTSIFFADVVCRDIRHDGLMDGLGEPTTGNASGQLFIGTTTLSPNYYRTVLAQNILEIAADPSINRAGLSATDLLDFANTISLNGSTLFAGVPPRPVDEEGPIISTSVANDTIFAGTADIPFSVSDPIGVNSVEFYVDDNFLANGDLNDLQASINTTTFSDGEHTLRVVARDGLDNESEITLPLRFVNTGADITINSTTLTNVTAYTATGTYMSVGAPIDRIEVGNVVADINQSNNTWSAGIVLESGNNIVTAVITDSVGNTNSADLTVGVDTQAPTLESENTDVLFSNTGIGFENCDVGVLSLGDSPDSSLCLDATKVSLNGIPISTALSSQNYILFGMNIFDENVDGVFTPISELLIEYRYERNGNTIVDWVSAPRLNSDSQTVLLPMTTEYFGSDFFKSSTNDQHEVFFRLTDNAGNLVEDQYRVSLETFTPELSISDANVANADLFSTSFANRTAINDADVIVEYTVNNDSIVPYFIRVTPDENHTVEHEWDTAERFHSVRQRTTRQWRKFNNTLVYTNALFGNDSTSINDGSGVWQSISSVLNWTGSIWETATPASVPDSAASFVNTDSPINTTPTGWEAHTIDNFLFDLAYSVVQGGTPEDCRVLVDYVDVDSPTVNVGSSLSWEAAFTQASADNPVGNVCEGWGESAGHANQLEQREVFEWVSQSGYPRNEFDSNSSTIDFSSSDIRVFNGDVELSNQSGWYLVPANSMITIRNTISLPTVNNFDDASVAANDATVPYGTTAELDSQITWDFATSIYVERSIAPINGSPSNVTVSDQTIDSPGESFSISR